MIEPTDPIHFDALRADVAHLKSDISLMIEVRQLSDLTNGK